MLKRVYSFGNGSAEGSAADLALLGGKGANLAEMAGFGLPVPPGFTITTETCRTYLAAGRRFPDGLGEEVAVALSKLQKYTGRTLGDTTKPLFVSVRSGAQASMPGMMDTVLNLGMNPQTVEALAKETGDARFAWDSYRRFIQMYCDVVLGLDNGFFEDILDQERDRRGKVQDTELTAEDWAQIVRRYLISIEEELGEPFPEDPSLQLWAAIAAVFKSWNNVRAATYRRLHSIPDDWGTAVTIQAMVFGNRGNDSATGVAFTRDPSTGERGLYGEFLPNAQGEDVVAGLRTPQAPDRIRPCQRRPCRSLA